MKKSSTKKMIGDILFYFFFAFLAFILLCQLGVFPLRLVYVRSGSMAPVINTGDLAVVRLDKNLQPKVGDIILFTDGHSDTIHRVISIKDHQLTTKGDFNNAADTSTVSKSKGIYLFSIPWLGYVVVFIQVHIFWFITLIVFLILIDVLYQNRLFPFWKIPKEDK